MKVLVTKYGEPREIKKSKTVVCTDPNSKQVKSDLEGYDFYVWEAGKIRGVFTMVHTPCQAQVLSAWNGVSYKVSDKNAVAALEKKQVKPESGPSKL